MNTSANPNPKEVWDALSNEMPEDLIVEMLVEEALSYLEYDDANPTVGMGMSYRTALQHAEKDVQLSATRWKRNIYITDAMRQRAMQDVEQARQRK